jgi:hypothetical protein
MPYLLPPPPVMNDPSVKCADSGMTPMQVKAIRELGDALIATRPLEAMVGFHEASRVDESKRKAITQWLPFPTVDNGTQWIYDLCADVVQQINGIYWRFDLTHFYDTLLYARYTAPSDHFTWHRDSGDDWRRPQRKLAFSLLLSEPSEYEGGGFQIHDGVEHTVNATEPGTFIIFPASMLHRVLPVTRGERRALIGWASGPPLR